MNMEPAYYSLYVIDNQNAYPPWLMEPYKCGKPYLSDLEKLYQEIMRQKETVTILFIDKNTLYVYKGVCNSTSSTRPIIKTYRKYV